MPITNFKANKNQILELIKYVIANSELDTTRNVKPITPGWLQVPDLLNSGRHQKTAEQWIKVRFYYTYFVEYKLPVSQFNFVVFIHLITYLCSVGICKGVVQK